MSEIPEFQAEILDKYIVLVHSLSDRNELLRKFQYLSQERSTKSVWQAR